MNMKYFFGTFAGTFLVINAVALTAIAQKPKPEDKVFRLRQNDDGPPDFECHKMVIGSKMSNTEIRDFLNDAAQEAYDYGCVDLVIRQEF